MNLRLNKNVMRFRINQEEVRLLKDNNSLIEEIFLPNNTKIIFKVIIGYHQEIILDARDNIFILLISEGALKLLEDNSPSKEGIGKEFIVNGNKLKVSIEIDVIKRKKY